MTKLKFTSPIFYDYSEELIEGIKRRHCIELLDTLRREYKDKFYGLFIRFSFEITTSQITTTVEVR